MIYDKLSNLETYHGIYERVYRALTILRDLDFSALEDGRHDYEGDKLFLNMQSYTTLEKNETPEGHKKYIDIQYMVSGDEYIGVGNLDNMTDEVVERRGSDIRFYHGPVYPVKLEQGSFMVLWPQDVHAPSVCVGEPAAVRKAVFKVAVED